MTRFIPILLESKFLWLIARILLSVVFISGGLAKIIDFDSGLTEMRHAGLEPALFFNLLTAGTLIGASVLILLDKYIWLASGALAIFLALTIIIVHHFWSLPPEKAKLALFFALEHVSLIGGLIATAIASHLHQHLRRW
jgi:transmembrane protein